ncbi:MAG: glycosyltransferase family 4 protein [Bacillota bacterium]
MLALLKAGVSVRLVPRRDRAEGGRAPALTWGRYGRIRDLLQASVQAHASRENVCVRHVWPPDFGRPRACGKFVLIQPWEYGYLPSAWVGPVRANVDEVWAYSRFVRDTYVRSGVPAAKVAVVHPGVDPFVFSADAPPAAVSSTKGYKFLFVGGAATSRKGFDVLLRAYVRAFRNSDDVSLIVKDYFYGPVEREIAAVQADPDAPEVVYLYENARPWVMPGYYAACDCLVSPYRAEGFGLPVLEAMACARPVITTGYGAALDFCDDSVAYLIPAREVPFPEARVGDFATCGTPVWAEPDEEGLVALLRHVFIHREEGRGKGSRARERVAAGFTWEHTARQVIHRLGILRS